MAGRKEVPPPRPPAPKLSLLKARHSSASSISIHFSALSKQDEEDDLDLSITGEVKDAGTSSKMNSGKINDTSHSAPGSQASTPMSRPVPFSAVDKSLFKDDSPPGGAKSEEQERSFLGGIKDTLKDKIPTIAEKILKDKDSEPRQSTSRNKDSPFHKAHSFDSARLDLKETGGGTYAEVVVKEDEVFLQAPPQGKHVTETVKKPDPLTSSENGLESNTATDEDGLEIEKQEMKLVEDFFQDPSDEFFEVIDPMQYGIPMDYMETDSKRPKNVTGFKELIRNKRHSKHPSPAPMSFSGLLSEIKTTPEEEEFHNILTDEESNNNQNKNASGPAESASSETPTKESSTDTVVKQSVDQITTPPWQKIAAATVALFAYVILPLPSYLAGMVFGCFLTALTIYIYNWINAAPVPKPVFVLPDLDKLPPLQVPEIKDSKQMDGKFKGWMNELAQYEPENYHINQTHSVYVQLEGTTLRLQRPKQNIPKRAMWDEDRQTAHFIHQRHLDMLGGKVLLLPFGLCGKRIWSKKYPISIHLPKTRSMTQTTDLSDQSDDSKDLENTPLEIGNTSEDQVLYLFARTCRDKEEWYRRFVAASSGKPLPCRLQDVAKAIPRSPQHPSPTVSEQSPMKHGRKNSLDSVSLLSSEPEKDRTLQTTEEALIEYLGYMGKIMPTTTRPKSPVDGEKSETKSAQIVCDPQILWTNALVSRLFWDFLRDSYWAEKVKEKIQRKLSKIHVPFFIDALTVAGITLGREMPTFRRASKPYLDEQGLWIDFDVAYNGGFQMTLETKVNLMKLKKNGNGASEVHMAPAPEKSRSPVTCSDEEDSAESSTDEEPEEEKAVETQDGGRGKKLWRIVDKITQSRYFQQATEYKYIKRAMEEVSNTPLVLTVEVRNLLGKLAINIPPPPTDRLWYGFRPRPQLWLSAKPRVGEREVTMTHITEWIEKKLETEFQRVLVLPNMDDLAIPLMRDCLVQAS